MPTINKYKNKSGFYIKSVHDGKITTFQVTDAGNQFLSSKKYEHKDEINIDFLMYMKRKGYIFTKGSGAGDIDSFFGERGFINLNRHKKHSRSLKRKDHNDLKGCLGIVIALLIIIFILSWCS